MVGQAESNMRVLKYGILAAFILAGCLEPQPVPELNQRASTDFEITTVVEGLNSPWSVAELPDGGYLITEKSGKLLKVTNRNRRDEIKGLPTLFRLHRRCHPLRRAQQALSLCLSHGSAPTRPLLPSDGLD